ncbi:unnamed protein product [Polarella glacialis]|uniref:Uncharacterized protein n=1 Tax=Polarella glacialis TaxID=89957 RepID=A0A813EYG8_POLGL|nr:unnamed protein product [Polarella glacialis]
MQTSRANPTQCKQKATLFSTKAVGEICCFNGWSNWFCKPVYVLVFLLFRAFKININNNEQRQQQQKQQQRQQQQQTPQKQQKQQQQQQQQQQQNKTKHTQTRSSRAISG